MSIDLNSLSYDRVVDLECIKYLRMKAISWILEILDNLKCIVLAFLNKCGGFLNKSNVL